MWAKQKWYDRLMGFWRLSKFFRNSFFSSPSAHFLFLSCYFAKLRKITKNEMRHWERKKLLKISNRTMKKKKVNLIYIFLNWLLFLKISEIHRIITLLGSSGRLFLAHHHHTWVELLYHPTMNRIFMENFALLSALSHKLLSDLIQFLTLSNSSD